MCCSRYHFIFLHAAQPNLGNLTVIVWENKEGKQEYFRFQELICDKWILIGDLIHIPPALLNAWKETYGNPLDRIRQVLTYWLDKGSRTYTVSWEGVYKLLGDVELTDIVAPLKEAIENAQRKLCSMNVLNSVILLLCRTIIMMYTILYYILLY